MSATTTELTPTQRQIISMLTENTGRSILDSGDYYGRHYERNQGRDFASERPAGLRITSYRDHEADITASLNIYHYLSDRLEYDAETDEHYREWLEQDETDDRRYSTYQEDIEAYVASRGGKVRESGYTYNNQNFLSQDFIWYAVSLPDADGITYDDHVVLQIHGGCDARGGFTAPRWFRGDTDGYDDNYLLDCDRMTISCAGHVTHHRRCSSCGNAWITTAPNTQVEFCDACGATDVQRYDETEYHTWNTSYDDWQFINDETRENLASFPAYDGDEYDELTPDEQPEQYIRLDDDGTAHCPHCAATLNAYPY